MRNEGLWVPSKFVMQKGCLRASRDPKAVSVASRVMADLTARFYDEVLPLHARGALMDLGCGHVPLFGRYRSLVSGVLCVDWANTLHASPHLDLEQDLNTPIAAADGSCDTIILSDVLEHIRRPEGLVREMHRLLRPGGCVIMNVPFFYSLHEEPHDYHRFTRHALKAMAEDAGFEVVRLEAIGGAPEIVADVLAKTLRSAPIIGRAFARFIQGFTAWFVRGGWGARFSRRTSASFPYGYGLVLRRR